MSKSSMTCLSSGKAKDIYETSDGNLLFEFTDRVTEFEDGVIRSLDKDVFGKGTGDLSTVYSELQELLLKQDEM